MDHRDRIDLLLAGMHDANLDAVIAFSNAAHHVDFADAVTMLSGVKPIAESFAILRADGRSHLVVSPDWDLGRAERMARTGDVTATADPETVFERLFDAGAKSRARVGTADLDRMPHGFAARVSRKFDRPPVDFTAEFYRAGARKTDDEIANARQATRIAEQAYEHLLQTAAPGTAECDMAAELKTHSRFAGADDNFMMFHAEGHPLAVQPSGERPFEIGDLILAEITPSYRGQFAQICRTACLGEPTDQQHEKYDLVVRAMKNGLARARPGVPMKEICLGIDEVLRDAGYGEYCEPPYMNRRGHGLGLTSTYPGNVSLDNETILEEGMFFVVHPNQYIPEVGYLLCGEPIVITGSGAEKLTRDYASLAAIAV